MLPIRISVHFTIIFIFVCLYRFASGGCLNYGHSCWGGHGKRSGSLKFAEGAISPQSRSTEWYLARLLKTQQDPLDARNIFGSENVVRGPGIDLVNYQDSRNRKVRVAGEADQELEGDDWNQEVNDSDEVVVVAPEVPIAPKLRLYQLLNDEALRRHSVG